MFSTAKIGEPAATEPTRGIPDASSTSLMPLEEPGTFSMTPFLQEL